MLVDIVFKQLEECSPIVTTHNVGSKRVLLSNGPEGVITQLAIGYLKNGESTESHQHHTMDEIFFIIAGDLTIFTDNKEYQCKNGTFIGIPAGFMHSLLCKSVDCSFFYLGINTAL